MVDENIIESCCGWLSKTRTTHSNLCALLMSFSSALDLADQLAYLYLSISKAL